MANTTTHSTTAAAAATTTTISSAFTTIFASSSSSHHQSHRRRCPSFTAPFSSVVSHQQQQQQQKPSGAAFTFPYIIKKHEGNKSINNITRRLPSSSSSSFSFFLFSSFFLFLLFSATPSTALYPKGSAVIVLDNASFQKTVVDSEDLFIVEFFADWCGHCQQFAPEYEKAAKALQNIVPFVAVSDAETMKKFDVKGFPTIKAMIGQKGKTPKMVDFVANRTAQQLVHFTTTQIRELTRVRLGGKDGASNSGESSSDVVELSYDIFDKLVMDDQRNVWFIKFYAPWCGHCKAMAADWEKVARSLKGKVKIGKVDAATDRILAKRFDVKGFPTLKLFPMGKKTDAMAQNYEGPRKADDLERYAMTFYSVKAKAEQLINNGQVDECKTGVCVFAFLPHILDSKAAGRENYLKDLNEVVKASVTMPITFFWAQGGDHFDFEEKLQMAFGYPALVALNVEKGKYSIHRGNFEKDSINSFLTGLMAGQVPLDPLPKELPKLSTIEKWDGKDGKAPEVQVEEDDEL